MHGQQQPNFFLPDGLSNSSSSSIDSAFNFGLLGQELGLTPSSQPSVPPLSSFGREELWNSFNSSVGREELWNSFNQTSSFGQEQSLNFLGQTPSLNSLEQTPSLSSLCSFGDLSPFPSLNTLGQQENSAFRRHLDHVINGKEGKMFVGGLSWLSTTDSMRAYFEKFGPVEECVIMRDAKTKITRGFGFVTFENPSHIQRVLTVKDHFLDGKRIDPQIAIRHISPARSVNNICRKVFIGGVSQHCSIDDVKQYFSRFGLVEDAILKMDYPKHQHRGFGFMTFVSSETAELVCKIRYHVLKEKTVECKMAQKKEFVKPNGEAAAAASTFLNSLPPEQVLAIYGALLRGITTNGTQTPALSTPQPFQSVQQPVYSNPIQTISQPAHMLQQPIQRPSLTKLPGPIGPPKSGQQTQKQTDGITALQQQQTEHDQLMMGTTTISNLQRHLTLKYTGKEF